MVAFNFQKRFVPKILDGTKTQTFRRTERCKVGDTMHLYTGQRTKDCVLILEKVCVAVCCGIIRYDQVTMNLEVSNTSGDLKRDAVIYIGESLNIFARVDGFDDHNQMLQFFDGKGIKFPFRGWLHRWAA